MLREIEIKLIKIFLLFIDCFIDLNLYILMQMKVLCGPKLECEKVLLSVYIDLMEIFTCTKYLWMTYIQVLVSLW